VQQGRGIIIESERLNLGSAQIDSDSHFALPQSRLGFVEKFIRSEIVSAKDKMQRALPRRWGGTSALNFDLSPGKPAGEQLTLKGFAKSGIALV
jgi:hypothetical protein